MSTDNLNGSLSSTGNLNGTFGTSGGGGTSNYNDLANKPQINGNTLEGNKTPEQLGISIPDMANYYNKSETNTLLDGKANVSDLPDMNNYYDKSETDNLLDGKADVSDLPDMNNYYDKSETDDLLDEKVDNSRFNAASLPITSGSATNTKAYIDNIADYSTSEKAVGKWIDGRTVYQKVIPVNITATNTWNNTETIDGITRIISAEFLIYEGGNRSNGIRQGLFAEISTTVPYLVQIFNNTGYNIQVDYMILKYIKS